MSGAGLAAFATLLLPVDGGAFLPADGTWTPPRAGTWPEADVVLWGAAPSDVGAPADAARRAARREAALATLRAKPPRGWRVRRVHRLAPSAARRDRLGRAVRAALGGGALVELHRHGATPPSRIDVVLARTGHRHADGTAWHLGPGGALLGFVEGPSGRAVARAAVDGAARPGTVGHGADGLAAVADFDLAPRLVARGCDDGVSWSLEEAVAGAPPRTVPPELVRRLAARLAELPSHDGAPTAPAQDVAAIVRHLPDRAAALSTVADDLAAGRGSVLRHGDFWAGNVLVDGSGAPVAVVDWDNWHDAAVPGSDLLQLLATERRHRARIGLGAVWRQRPWRDDDVRRLLAGVDLERAATAWWVTEVAGSLQRDPQLAANGRWVAENVDGVLDEVSR